MNLAVKVRRECLDFLVILDDTCTVRDDTCAPATKGPIKAKAVKAKVGEGRHRVHDAFPAMEAEESGSSRRPRRPRT